jgi:hypothetical protein
MKPNPFWGLIGVILGGAAWALSDYRWIGAFVCIFSGLGLIGGLGYHHWFQKKKYKLRSPLVLLSDDASPDQAPSKDQIYPTTAACEPPPLERSLYVSDIRFTFDKLRGDRYSELTMWVFNGSGRVVEIGNVSGRITFNSPNNTYPNRMGVLPTPALRSDVKRTVVQLEERRLMFDQRVPPTEADKLLAMIRAKIPIHFELGGLNIEVFPQEDRSKVEHLPLWFGVSYERGFRFGRVSAGSGAVPLR